jgi:hypothetical protein
MVRAVGNGKGSGQWAMGNGQWAMGNGQGSGQWQGQIRFYKLIATNLIQS